MRCSRTAFRNIVSLAYFSLNIDGCGATKSPIPYGMSLSILEMMHCLKIAKFITEFIAAVAADEGLEMLSKLRMREDEGRAGDALN